MRLFENGALSSVRLTPTLTSQISSARRQVALGRSVSKDQRTPPLPLASSGSGWQRIGYSGPEQAEQEGSKEVLSQTLKGIAVCSACDHYRQIEELQRRES